jgi:membrane-bound lytic murein transglycosylase A
MSNGEAGEGLITGYFEPYLKGSLRPSPEYSHPLYRKPKDLVSVNLGKFKKEWRGKKIFGKLNESELVPYDERADIQKGTLRGKNLELFWVNDAVEAFFLHIQGSGLIIFPDGTKERVGYAGKNGQPYFAIGRDLIERGALTRKEVSLQTIRSWLKAHPLEAQSLMNKNKSFIFFKVIKGSGPLGAQAVPLTPGHSLAVDPKFVPLGVPIWLVTSNPLNPGEPLRRLVIAQDTGSAIKGAVRADLFWGAGRRARLGAGRMKERGYLYIFLPRSAATDKKLGN